MTVTTQARLPYVGVTGFMTAKEVMIVLDNCLTPDEARAKVMVGVLASDTTLSGKKNNHPRQYPLREDIEDIFNDNPLALNLVHYNTHSEDNLLEQLMRAYQYGGKNCHGLQLNIAWPDIHVLSELKLAYPEIVIVLQIGSLALDELDNDLVKLIEVLTDYRDYIDYILLDPSGGTGKRFDINTAKAIIVALQQKDLDKSFGIGVAGGIDAENVLGLQELFDLHPELSIDAQGRLRDENDDLDTYTAWLYVLTAMMAYHC